MGIPLCVICCFSLVAFNICSLCLIFVNLINMSWGVSPWAYPVWDSLCFLDLADYFFPHFREFSTIVYRLLENTAPTANIILGITGSFLLRVSSSKNVHYHPESIVGGKRRNKVLGKADMKLALFADDIILYTKFYNIYRQLGRINKRA